MPPKKDAKAVQSQRTAFVDTVGSAGELTHEHALQLAGLGRASGFSLGDGPRAHRSHDAAGAEGSKQSGAAKGKGKQKANEVIELSDTDDEIDLLGGPSAAGGGAGGADGPKKPHVCSRTKCSGNPNCLAYLGQEKWLDDVDKAREAFLKKALPDGNPMNLAREPGAPCGLRLGATCYANALLQTWFHNEQFRHIVFSLAAPPSSGDFRRTPLYQLQTVFHGLEASNQSHFDPKGLVEALQLEQGEQQDAQEFSKLFLDLISKAVPPIRPGELEENAVETQFGGSLEYVTKCKRCKYESRRTSKFTELDLTIKSGKPIEFLLDELLQHETMSGDNKYDCPECGKLQDAERYIEIGSLPPTLNLSLLRFVFDPNVGDRVKTKRVVRFPPSLDMRPFVTRGADVVDADDEDLVYDLRAVLVHKGESANSGHYCAQVCSSMDGKWYECDDEAVLEIKPLTPPSAPPAHSAQSPPTKAPSHPAFRPSDRPRSSPSAPTALAPLPPIKKKATPGPSQSPENDGTRSLNVEEILDAKYGRSGTASDSGGSPPRKKAKSSIPPWALKKDSEPIDLISGDIDDTIEVEERPACYVPSFLPIVPEHAYMSAPSSKRKSPERAAALATISHAQADSSQRTYSHQKGSAQRSSASKSASPEKVDYQSSKDAYMLVYQRRPRRHAMADIVEAPPHVQQDIAQRNLDWKLSCAIWELKQAVAAETFDEVLAAKSAVFDQWEVASFDEPAYVLPSDGLSTWVGQGLWEKLKKSDKGEASNASEGMAKGCNGCSEEPLKDADAVITIDDDVAQPPPETAPAAVGFDLFALEPEQVSPLMLEDELAVATAKGAFKARLKAGALAHSFDPVQLCPHGKTQPLLPSALTCKRVSEAAVEELVRLGCTLKPGVAPLSPDSLCLVCTQNFFNTKATKKQHTENVETFKGLNAGVGDPGQAPRRFISKAWFNEYMSSLKAEAVPGSPAEDRYQKDVICAHGNLSPNKVPRRLITAEAYAFLAAHYDDFNAPSENDDECEACLTDRLPDLVKAHDEKARLMVLYKRCVVHVHQKRESLNLGALAVVDSEFLLAWHRWIDKPTSYSRPTLIDTHQFVCAHNKLTLDLSNRYELDDHRFAFVTAVEWTLLKSLYEHGPTILAECVDQTLHDTLANEWEVEMETCEDCRRVEKRQFTDGYVTVVVTDSAEALEGPLHKAFTGQAIRHDAGGRDLPAGGSRKSKRKRGAGKVELDTLDVKIDHTDTVKTIKVAVSENLDTSVLYLTLYKGSSELEDASKTVDELDIIPGDCLVVYKQPDLDEDEQEQLAIAGVSHKAPRRSQADVGAGFGGTLLSGGFASRPSSSQSKPASSSTSSTLKSGSPDPAQQLRGSSGRSGRRVEEIGAALEAGDNVSEQDMEAYFTNIGAADGAPAAASVSCPKCTFVNELDFVACVMCDALLATPS